MSKPTPCDVRSLHYVTYENGTTMQESLVLQRQRDEIADQLLLLEHFPVITQGRAGKPENLLANSDMLLAAGVEVHATSRGGDITWHGPGQLVGYPILHLGEGARDIRKYVTRLEEVLIRTLRDFGIEAAGSEKDRGVWVGTEKIAAIGVRIARWVTSHGFALNIDPDLSHFEFIRPCGLHDRGVTSMTRLLGRKIDRAEVEDRLLAHFREVFERETSHKLADKRIVKVVATSGQEILLLHRNAAGGDFWQTITGGIEAGETDHAAAKRELEEETGHTAEVSPLVTQSFTIDPVYLGQMGTRPLFVDEVAFAATLDREKPLRIDHDEHDQAGWYGLEESIKLVRWSDDKAAIRVAARSKTFVAAPVQTQATTHHE